MKNPYAALLKASRLTRKGRPLSAAMTLNKLIFAPAKPAAKRKKATAKLRTATKPVRSRPSTRPVPGSFVDRSFSSASGAISYKLYTPTGSPRRKLPLVVMLHGCTQSAADFAAGTGMNALADELGFLVLYPEQSTSANLARCWNWHRSGDQKRGGEPATIAALTRHIITNSKADAARVYVAGMSAGGAAAAIVAAAYPDVFVAVGVHSGLARGKISSLSAALSAMRSGVGPAVSGGRRRKQRPTIVFHGDRDDVVHPSNVRGFVNALPENRNQPLAITQETGRSSGGRDFTRTTYRSGSGELLLEDWSVHGSGHAWSGGSSAGSHTDPAGPSASREMLRFFLAQKRTS